MDWTTIETIGTTLANKAGNIALDKATDTNFWEKLYKWFNKERKEILILGCSGVGKTQFIHSLNDNTKNIVSRTRTEASETVKATIENKPFCVIDTVGQEAQPKERIGILEAKLQDENLVGIINLVGFGYHERFAELPTNVFEGDSFQVKDDFLEENRQKELKYLQEWLPILHISKVKWVITLVNKIDIWKREANIVQQYYENIENEYQQAFIKTFESKRFDKKHIVLPYTSALELFYKRHPIFVGEFEKLLIQNHFKNELLRLLKKDN